MSDSKTLPPEFAATAGDLMAYRARERFNLFELACLLHRADPERVHNDTWNGWRDRKLQIGFDRAELTPALFIGELDLMPELLAGPLIGGTIKQLKKAIGCATIMHSIGADQARTLADSLGLAFPPELSAAQPPQPAPQAEVTAGGVSGAPAWVVTRPQRYRGYASPLYRFLSAAHSQGKPRPSARDVIEEWRARQPAEIAQVMPDGVNYYDSKGNTKAADLEAIRKAIDRMTSAR